MEKSEDGTPVARPSSAGRTVPRTCRGGTPTMSEETPPRNITTRPHSPPPVGPYPVLATGLMAYTRRVIVTVLILAVAYLLWRGTHVLLQAFAGVLFAVFLHALAEWLSKRSGMRYGRALGVVVLTLLLVVGVGGWLLSNHVLSQASQLADKLPQSLQQLRDSLDQSPLGRKLLGQMSEGQISFTQVLEFLRAHAGDEALGDFLVTAVVVFFVGVFGAAEPALYRVGLLHLVPGRHRQRTNEALDAVAFNLRWWLLGQVFLMVAIGLSTTVGLWIIGV